MEKNNKNLNLLNNLFIRNRAMCIIALFIFFTSLLRSQIVELENKFLWITRESMVDKESISSALLFANEMNFDKVFLQIRGRGDAFYNSSIVKKNINILDDFDPLEYAVQFSDSLDIEIHAWINCYILWSSHSPPLDKNHILYTNPSWMEFNIYGKSDSQIDLEIPQSPQWEGIYLSPMNKQVNQYLRDIIKEIYDNYDIDGFHLDYIRYQDDYYGFHPDGRKEFDLSFNVDPLDISRGIISVRYGWEESYVDSVHASWHKFKQDKITELLEFINDDVQKNIPISVAVKPNLQDAQYRWHQDWKYWLERDLVDFVIPMNYSKEIINFMTNIKMMRKDINEEFLNKIIMGISVYNQDAESVVDKIFLSRINGFNGISLFSYEIHKNEPEWFAPILESLKEP